MTAKVNRKYFDETLKLLKNFNILEVSSSENKYISIIKKAITMLPDVQQEVIIERFIYKRDWMHVSFETDISESYCKKLCNKAVESITLALYGFEAYVETK